jgi:hypothetical protein
MKQLQRLFHSLPLQADSTALIPPYLMIDRNAQGLQDLSTTHKVASLRGMGSVEVIPSSIPLARRWPILL